jgi:hypothetical protein
VINGEKAAYCTPTFAEKRERTLGLLLKGVEQKCSTEVWAYHTLKLEPMDDVHVSFFLNFTKGVLAYALHCNLMYVLNNSYFDLTLHTCLA